MIEKRGSNSTVVWNPWQAKASALDDLGWDRGADAWPHFVCVEPANAAENAVTLPPGAVHTMGFSARVETIA